MKLYDTFVFSTVLVATPPLISAQKQEYNRQLVRPKYVPKPVWVDEAKLIQAVSDARDDSTSPPIIKGWKFQGLGFCENTDGNFYDYETILHDTDSTVGECAAECKQVYSSEPKFAGINYHPDWYGAPNCNCMMMSKRTNTVITGSNGWNEELCYSWDEAQNYEVPEVPAPTIEDFTFEGMGCCINSEDEVFDYETVPGDTVEECAAACSQTYSSDPLFAGINFLPDVNNWGWTNCNCMKAVTHAGEPNGKIVGAGGWCHIYDELCYSYNLADPPSVDF